MLPRGTRSERPLTASLSPKTLLTSWTTTASKLLDDRAEILLHLLADRGVHLGVEVGVLAHDPVLELLRLCGIGALGKLDRSQRSGATGVLDAHYHRPILGRGLDVLERTDVVDLLHPVARG